MPSGPRRLNSEVENGGNGNVGEGGSCETSYFQASRPGEDGVADALGRPLMLSVTDLRKLWRDWPTNDFLRCDFPWELLVLSEVFGLGGSAVLGLRSTWTVCTSFVSRCSLRLGRTTENDGTTSLSLLTAVDSTWLDSSLSA
jgi:hypothetical protein